MQTKEGERRKGRSTLIGGRGQPNLDSTINIGTTTGLDWMFRLSRYSIDTLIDNYIVLTLPFYPSAHLSPLLALDRHLRLSHVFRSTIHFARLPATQAAL